jgi:hypothetical protein
VAHHLGTTVERRDQVLTTRFSLTRFIPSIFSRRNVSTNGPFFSDLLITVLDVPAAASAVAYFFGAAL